MSFLSLSRVFVKTNWNILFRNFSRKCICKWYSSRIVLSVITRSPVPSTFINWNSCCFCPETALFTRLFQVKVPGITWLSYKSYTSGIWWILLGTILPQKNLPNSSVKLVIMENFISTNFTILYLPLFHKKIKIFIKIISHSRQPMYWGYHITVIHLVLKWTTLDCNTWSWVGMILHLVQCLM